MTSAATRSITAGEIAAACGGRLVGDAARVLTGVRSLEKAGPESVGYATGSKEEKQAAASAAGLLVVRSEETFPGRDVVVCERPDIAIADVLLLFHPVRVAVPGVHPSAVVGEGAEVDPTAEVGPYAVIGSLARVGPGVLIESHVVIGNGCDIGAGVRLHPHVTLYDGVILGPRVEIHSGAVIGADGFGYVTTPQGIRKVPQVGNVVVDALVEIGANSCVDRATLETTRVGAGTKIDDLVMVGHNCVIGRHCFICSQTGMAGSAVLGDGVVIGGQVGLSGHQKVGSGVKVGAQSGVWGDVPDGASINGSPHMEFRLSMKVISELRKLPETARLVRRLAASTDKDGE